MKKPAFYFNMNACTGCKTCMIACIDKYDVPKGVQYRRVSEYTGGSWVAGPNKTFEQNVFVYYLSIACNHCENPICADSCPTTAMHKQENGIVVVDEGKCIGCRYCEWVCPYSAPQFNAESGKMEKCDFCRDFQSVGKSPACVSACPTRALDYGEYDELVKMYGETHVAPLPDKSVTNPLLAVTPHRHAQPIGLGTGKIANPEEV